MIKKTILIVEDDAILAIDLQRILFQLGYAVAGPFSSGEEAIIFLTDNMVDLVLMDIELAGRMNGITTAETLNRTSDIPIVFLTGFSQDPLLEQAKIAAPYGYLIKPVPERELAATLEIALHRRVLDQKLKESQIALAESEARYRHLFENSSLGIFRTTIDGKVLAINTQMARILGYDTPDEALEEFTDLAKQLYVDQDLRQEFITLLKEKGFINNFEYCGRKKNGKTVWISMNAKLTATDELSGQTADFVIDGFAMDITESKKAAEALRESEEKFRTMANNTYDWEYWVDPEGRLIYTSPSCERITGYKAESFQQDPDLLYTVIHPDDRDRFMQHRDDATKGLADLDCHKPVFRILAKSGEEYWIEHICKEVFDRQGKSLGRRVSHRDITEWKTAESALQINAAHLQSIFRAAPVGIGVVVNRVLTQVNERLCEITGYTHDELIKQSSRILYLDEFDYEFVGLEKYRQIGMRGTGTVETQWCCKDGSMIDVLLSSTPFDTSDLAKGVTFTALNITEQKQAEKALLKRKSYFRALFDNAGDAILIENMQDRIIDANPQACELLGYTREELLQLYVPDLQAPECRGQRGSVVRNELATLNKALFETVDVKKDGSLVPVEIKTVPFRAENEDLALSIVRDITERKKAVFERDRLVQAIEQSGETIVITDLEGFIQYANPAFEKITGHSCREVVDKKINLLKSGYHDDAFYRDLWETISGGKIWKGQIINIKKDGTLYTEEATISPVIGTDGSIVNYIAVKVDITEKLKSDKEKACLEAQYIQAQKMEAVGRLAGGVAHDFNNMLSVIIGYSEIAQEKNESGALIGRELTTILQAAEKSAGIVKQLLAFARKQAISPKVINFNDTVESMLKMIRRLIGEDIDLTWIPMKRLWPVNVDPSQVDQILANLCVNARDATTDVGKITIETGMATFDEEYCATHAGFIPGDFVSLTVSDNGCGIKKDRLELIFEPFFTSKEVGQGTGLGLATVHGIVKQNHGFINVYSELGEGTTFKVYLPRSTENIQESLLTIPLIPESEGESILLVEDDPELLQLAQEMLQRLGYCVLSAATPMEALKIIENDDVGIDLLITDVVMPGMNGRELARKLTVSLPALKVLFMSGYTADVIVHHGVLDEDIHFMQKPYTRKDLAVKIREVVEST